jgi:hypothetical protein
MFHDQLLLWATDSKYPDQVVESLKVMLNEVTHEIHHDLKVSKDGPACARSSVELDQVHPEGEGAKLVGAKAGGQQNKAIIKELATVKAIYDAIPDDEFHRGMLGEAIQADNLLGKVDDMIKLIEEQWVDDGMAKVVNQIFLALVFNNYWKLIEEGALRPGSAESEVLLTSVRISLSPYRADLNDFDYVYTKMIADDEFKDQVENGEDEFGGIADAEMAEVAKKGGYFNKIVSSGQFNIAVALAFLLN